ncbi:immunity protein Imm33 domain-containing protein [Arthrobacter sp. HY1533]|uniref:immunity protein Imm33 domain-containing protein n=1 Tax=Arthrobacter sp. HY1533 TaxID=2970919 RepID=UPI003FA41C41
MNGISNQQLDVCLRFGAEPLASPSDMKVGISRNVQDGLVPINGLRHAPVGDTTCWYIWAGEELSDDCDFFVPLHVSHLATWCPQVIDYLALPPGSRLLLAPGYADIWFDAAIVHD